MNFKVGDLRKVKAGTKVWSISNQANITVDETIIEITHTCVPNVDSIFAKPMQIIFPHMIPGIISKGKDEWSLNINDTEPYKVPEPQMLEITYIHPK